MTDIYTKKIYVTSAGWGYNIMRNGIVENDQPHAPGLPGFVSMTETEANAYADIIMNLKMNPPIPPTVITFDKNITGTELGKVKDALDTFSYGYNTSTNIEKEVI